MPNNTLPRVMDPSATPKEFSLIIYDKTEIDDMMNLESTRVDTNVDEKIDSVDKGISVATLIDTTNSEGTQRYQHSPLEMPIATVAESLDKDVTDKVMTPQRVSQVLETGGYVQKTQADLDYGDLESDGSVKMSAAYNPQNPKDIATVEYVQTLASASAHNFIVDTQAEMLALTGIAAADICYVTNEVDHNDNGEFIAKIDDPILLSDWAERESKLAWGGIIGTLSDQTDLQVTLDAKGDKSTVDTNTADIATLNAPKTTLVAQGHFPATELDVENGGTGSTLETTYMSDTGHKHVVSTIQWLAGQNEADWTLSNKDTGVTETMFRILNGGKATIGTTMNQQQIATVEDIANVPNYFNIQDKGGVDLNTILASGKYYTNGANRPAHSPAGVMEVVTDEASGHIVQITETDGDFKKWVRAFDGAGWSSWVEDNVSHVIGLAFSMIIGKASKSSLPTIFSGENEPLDTLGKDLDWYHRFEQGSSTTTDLYTGTSLQNYHPLGFFLMNIQYGDIIEVAPAENLIYVDIADNSTLPVENLSLTLGTNVIPLTIESNSAGLLPVVFISIVTSYSLISSLISSTFKKSTLCHVPLCF